MQEQPTYPFEALDKDKVHAQLHAIMADMEAAVLRHQDTLAQLHNHYRISGVNLLHYLVLRSHEIRRLQDFLLHAGLSSLAHSEGYIHSQIRHVMGWLGEAPPAGGAWACDFRLADELRAMHTTQLLGEAPNKEKPHVMVTFSAENMVKPKLVEDMLNEGMAVARINCAHDDEEAWLKMLSTLRRAMAKTGRPCKVYMDLAGPKIRVHALIDKDGQMVQKMEMREGRRLLLCAEEGRAIALQQVRPIRAVLVQPAEIIARVAVGEQIYFDDGKFGGQITAKGEGFAEVTLTRIAAKKPNLRLEKGINLPNTDLHIPALTDDDRRNLPFVCQHADMVGFSFVKDADDVEALRILLQQHSRGVPPAMILKIERLAAVQNLPALLLNGMKDASFGVMIARGDLAVEIGFERLSEIQQEILWICEAAHVPVIWATQVLESLNKNGAATRSEITDAAMSVRAECVMLNKGQYIVETIRMLNDILTRQLGHVSKKRYIMRPLAIATGFLRGEGS